MLKSFKLFLLTYLIFTCQTLAGDFNFTKDYKLKIFDDENNIIKKNKKFNFPSIGASIDTNYFLKKGEKNNFNEIIIATKIKSTRYGADVYNYLYSYFFKNSGALFNPNQNLNLYLKNGANVIVAQDFNINEYINNSKDDMKEFNFTLKNFLEENSIDIPESALRSDHLFLQASGSAFWISYIYNYHLQDKSLQNNSSKFIDNWISLSIKRHDIFQNSLKISSKIDFSNNKIKLDNDLDYFRKIFYDNQDINKNNKTSVANSEKPDNEVLSKEKSNKSTNLDLENQIKKLQEINELYDSGIINEDEMKLLKDKILKN